MNIGSLLVAFSALGQGAFGEVYHGIYKSPEEKQDIQVAVKVRYNLRGSSVT